MLRYASFSLRITLLAQKCSNLGQLWYFSKIQLKKCKKNKDDFSAASRKLLNHKHHSVRKTFKPMSAKRKKTQNICTQFILKVKLTFLQMHGVIFFIFRCVCVCNQHVNLKTQLPCRSVSGTDTYFCFTLTTLTIAGFCISFFIITLLMFSSFSQAH